MIPCCICSMSFNNPQDLCIHIKKHHSSRIYSLRCTICERLVFTELWKYKRHLNEVCFKSRISESVEVREKENDRQNYLLEFEKMVDNSAIALACKLAANMSLPRNHTYEMLNEFKNFFTTTVLKGFDQYVMPYVNLEEQSNVAQFIQICRNPFRSVDTEYKLNNVLQQAQLISPLHSYDMNKDMQTELRHKPEWGVIMPMKFQFKKFFELPGVFDITQQFATEVSRDTNISHFLNATVWKEKLAYFQSTDTVIPYHLHIDDTQVNNALGSHKSKGLETCCYYSFPSIPPQYSSRLENIFAAQLFSSGANKKFGNFTCFSDLKDELNKIAKDPVTLNIDERKEKVYFVLGLILGDNKGINDFSGFAKSHNATCFCRFCKLEKSQTKIRTNQDDAKMRNKENYAEDVRKNDAKLTGIVEDSIVNLIFLCHATVSLGVDIMHDVFEGILHYHMCAIITNFIKDPNLDFTLAKLNQLKSDFDYGEVESGNKSPPITSKRLKKKKLQMSASEMQCFFHHFGLIVGDLIPKNDKTWKFYLQTVKFVDLLYLQSYSENELSNIASTISKMNAMYKKLFNLSLTPKHHYIIHYPTMIRRFGPLYYISSMRYEAKHKALKNYTKNTTSRINLSLSLGKKLQYNFAYRILSNIGLNDNVVMGRSNYINLQQSDMMDKIENAQLLQHLFDENTKESLTAIINGIRFSKNLYIVLKEESKLILNEIVKIIYLNETISDIYFVCKEFRNVLFNKNLECYEVNTVMTDTLKAIRAKEVLKQRLHPVTVQVVMGNNNFRFRNKPY